MRATGERLIFREKKNACAFGFVFMLLCSVWFCVDFFYDGFVVCCFGGFRSLFDNLLNMLYESFPR